MKHVLVLGKNGFVSKTFARYMKKYADEYQVVFISSRGEKWKSYDFSSFDVVFNASGLAHANAKDGGERDYYEVNGKLPGEIAGKAKEEGVPLYITISSSIIYGDMSNIGSDKIIGHETVIEPETIYGKSKFMGEKEAQKYVDDKFSVAIIRTPMIYSEYAPENFEILCKFACRTPIFPEISNAQSMIYADNFCELIRLIIDNSRGGIYYPQEREYIITSKLVYDIAKAAGKKVYMTRAINSILKLLSYRIRFIRKAFGSIVYKKEISNHFNWSYCVVPYDETIRRIARKYGKQSKQ